MSLAAFLAYLGVCVMVTLSPGPDTFLVLRFSLIRRSLGLMAAVGMVLSIFGWALLAGAGAASLMQRWPVLESIIAVAGGLYLLYLGISGFLASRTVGQAGSHIAHTEEHRSHESSAGYTKIKALRAGILSAALNPKLGLLFLAMMPGFIPRGGNTLLWGAGLGAVFALIGFAYLATLSIVASKAVGWLGRPEITQRLEWAACAALCLVGVGVIAGAVFI